MFADILIYLPYLLYAMYVVLLHFSVARTSISLVPLLTILYVTTMNTIISYSVISLHHVCYTGRSKCTWCGTAAGVKCAFTLNCIPSMVYPTL